MSRICFISLGNLYAVPYLSKYVKMTSENYDIIYWDREGNDNINLLENQFRFIYPIKKSSPISKLRGYIKFRKYAKKVLLKNEYERVVALTSNAAVLLGDVLVKKFRGKYIIDIRDYFKENNPVYYWLEKNVIKNSGLAIISSNAYRRFLPEHQYVLAHNSPDISIQTKEKFKQRAIEKYNSKSNEPIRISFIGVVRFFEQDKKILSYFANDDRFVVKYIGAGAQYLETFCKESNIRNVFLHDKFEPSKTLDFYWDTDIILNLYGNGSMYLDYALSNKLYYASHLYMPILVSPDTYMEEICIENGFGISVDLEDSKMRQYICKYYNEIDGEVFCDRCDNFNRQIEQQEQIFSTKVGDFLKIE